MSPKHDLFHLSFCRDTIPSPFQQNSLNDFSMQFPLLLLFFPKKKIQFNQASSLIFHSSKGAFVMVIKHFTTVRLMGPTSPDEAAILNIVHHFLILDKLLSLHSQDITFSLFSFYFVDSFSVSFTIILQTVKRWCSGLSSRLSSMFVPHRFP